MAYTATFPVCLLASQIRFRLEQLAAAHLMPRGLNNIRSVLAQKYDGDITIVPDMNMDDYMQCVAVVSDPSLFSYHWLSFMTKILIPLCSVVSNPTPERFGRAIQVGQRATWPKLSLIMDHCKIELALDDIVHRLRGCERWSLQ
jgi:TAG lipase/steryl ester hydrolase/phospholipase A2/LPA acyltransferase